MGGSSWSSPRAVGRIRNRHQAAFMSRLRYQSNSAISWKSPSLISRREHSHRSWQYLDLNQRWPQYFAISVKKTIAVARETYARRADAIHVRIRQVTAS